MLPDIAHVPQIQPRHSYQRRFDPLGADSLAKLARLIAPGSRVLDVGCGPGILGSYLAEEKGCIVDGLEINEADVMLARKTFRQVFTVDLEGPDPVLPLAAERYDYIICADVLEHLRDPGRLIDHLRPLLAPSARMLISLPNIAYSGLIAGLIEGQFRYTLEGLLDETHVRFFTRSSLLEWLPKHGLQPLSIDTVEMPLEESEFAVMLDGFPPALLKALLARPDAITYQFIVEANTSDHPEATVVVTSPHSAALGFLVQLYWVVAGEVIEANSVYSAGRMAVSRQRLVLKIPPQKSGLSGLRFDLTNKPGLLTLFDLVLHDARGECLWKWDGTSSLLAWGTGCVEAGRQDAGGGLQLLCDDDPRIDLPLTPDMLTRLSGGGALMLELSWPATSDGAALAKRFFGREEQLERIVELTMTAREYCRQAADALTRSAQLETDLQGALAERDALRAALRDLNDSIVYKLAKPIFPMVNWVKGRLGNRR